MTTRTAWRCPDCGVMHAPHIDRCECQPDAAVRSRVEPLPTVSIPSIWTEPAEKVTGTITVAADPKWRIYVTGTPFRPDAVMWATDAQVSMLHMPVPTVSAVH